MATNTSLTDIVARALRSPAVLVLLLRASWRFRARGWWRRPPFLPLPPREYVAWRMHTAYGGARAPNLDELGRYLRWANRLYRTRKDGVRR